MVVDFIKVFIKNSCNQIILLQNYDWYWWLVKPQEVIFKWRKSPAIFWQHNGTVLNEKNKNVAF